METAYFNEVYNGKHFCAFEVEELATKERLMYIYDPRQNCVVALRSTNLSELSIAFVVETNFPWFSKNAWEYFQKLYQKSISHNENMIRFVRFVNPANMQTLDLKMTGEQQSAIDNFKNNSIIDTDIRL